MVKTANIAKTVLTMRKRSAAINRSNGENPQKPVKFNTKTTKESNTTYLNSSYGTSFSMFKEMFLDVPSLIQIIHILRLKTDFFGGFLVLNVAERLYREHPVMSED